MSTESVDLGGRRIIKKKIKKNVEVVRSGRVKPKALAKRMPLLWLWVPLLIASVAYLAVPSLVVSRGKETSSHAAAVDVIKSTSPGAGPELKTEEPLSPPYRMNRAAFPLLVKRIVIDPGHGVSNMVPSRVGVPGKTSPWTSRFDCADSWESTLSKR
jgi:N-acetylmuramoyl-L-alanine amidase